MSAILAKAKITSGQVSTSTAAIPATAVKSGGLARTPKGTLYIIAQGVGEVPKSAIRQGGWAYSADGALYTTNTAPASTAVWRDGIAVRKDGAVHVTSSAGVVNSSGFSVSNGRISIV